MTSNADIAVAALRAMTTPSQADEFLDALTPDATWTIPGDWPRISGIQRRPQLDSFVRIAMPAGFPAGSELQIRNVAEAGDTVFVELVATAVTGKGRDYENRYCFVVDLLDGKVAAIREYMDTLYADRVLHQ
jgi:ketosteroid isomerase-like protein